MGQWYFSALYQNICRPKAKMVLFSIASWYKPRRLSRARHGDFCDSLEYLEFHAPGAESRNECWYVSGISPVQVTGFSVTKDEQERRFFLRDCRNPLKQWKAVRRSIRKSRGQVAGVHGSEGGDVSSIPTTADSPVDDRQVPTIKKRARLKFACSIFLEALDYPDKDEHVRARPGNPLIVGAILAGPSKKDPAISGV